jgi:anti-sigma-K factor RskA
MLLLQDLPRQPASRTYQVWVIRDGPPASAAVLPPGADGQQVVELQQDLDGVHTVAVSVEPAGGSPSPTGPIVLAGNL